MIAVDGIRKGEKRMFPYLGNVPSIAFKECEKNNYADIQSLVFEIMKYTLRTIYKKQDIKYRTSITGKQANTILTAPPELFTFLNLKNKEDKIIIYPDPPLGEEELNLLKGFNSDFEFFTPIEFFNL